MALPPPPSGYLNRKVAQSMEEAVQTYTTDHIKTLVKAGIQRYIESFMNKDGGNRSLYETFTKMGLQYITDKSFDPASDPTLRKMQIARLFEQLHQQLPAILIVDSDFKNLPMNFTGLERVRFQGGKWYGTLQVIRQLTISVVAGTNSQTNTDFLQSLLSVIFGEIKFLAGGTRITGNRKLGETWVMTLGLPVLGGLTQTPIGEDPKDKVWGTTIEIPDILFEDSITIEQSLDKLKGGTSVMNPTGDLADTPPVIYAPTTIPMNESTQVRFGYFQPSCQKVIISDPNIATYEPRYQTITPRRLGTFQLQVIRPDAPLGKGLYNQQNGSTVKVVASQTIRVTAR